MGTYSGFQFYLFFNKVYKQISQSSPWKVCQSTWTLCPGFAMAFSWHGPTFDLRYSTTISPGTNQYTFKMPLPDFPCMSDTDGFPYTRKFLHLTFLYWLKNSSLNLTNHLLRFQFSLCFFWITVRISTGISGIFSRKKKFQDSLLSYLLGWIPLRVLTCIYFCVSLVVNWLSSSSKLFSKYVYRLYLFWHFQLSIRHLVKGSINIFMDGN